MRTDSSTFVAATSEATRHLEGVPLILDPTFGNIGLGFCNGPRIVHPLLEQTPAGVGDTFTASLTSHHFSLPRE